MSVPRQINPRVRGISCPERDDLQRRASEIRVELQQGGKKAYRELIDLSWGDSHSAGMKPLTFVRQVIAGCLYPELLHSDKLPADVGHRAQKLLRNCDGESVGSYTNSCGLSHVQRSVAEFITRRDRGVPVFPENIFISSGSLKGLMMVLKLLVRGDGPPQTGVMTPVPSYGNFSMVLAELGALPVPYHLCEEQGWALQVDQLRRALQASRGHCSPRVLYVINPGNPTGHVQTKESIEEVIRFAAEEKLFLLADEVYQDNVYADGCEFVSYKKVLFEMGPEYSDTVQLASVHSVSKGFMGECGLRTGYVELVNLDPVVMEMAETLLLRDICAPLIGQIALDVLASPPQPGDPSHGLYTEEVRSIQETLLRNVGRAQEALNGLPGISCQPSRGGIYIFPRLHLGPRAVEQARNTGVEAGLMYCRSLLEEEGLVVGTGCDHGQRGGTYHIRLCVMTPTEKLEEALRRLTRFHLRFINQFP